MVTATRSVPAPRELDRLAREFEACSPQEILRWVLGTYASRVVLGCSFGGPTGMALLDMTLRIDATTPVYYLDTGLLFEETHELVRRASERYGIVPIAVRPRASVAEQALEHGAALWTRDPDRCCRLRKVEPQRAFLSRYDAWISGLRRDQAATRSATPVVEWDATFGLVKANPMAAWSERDVWRYLADNGVPYSTLHARGYASVGCAPCTRPVAPGEDPRSGRWVGFDKVECGLHLRRNNDVSEAEAGRHG